MAADVEAVLKLLKIHYQAFSAAKPFADRTAHPVPCDTRAWSQILCSMLSGINGIARKKGADLADGSDVKAANTWSAIDTPRFNGVIKSGRVGARGSIECLKEMPHLFFVLWDHEPAIQRERCRVWVIRPCSDPVFNETCAKWYAQRDAGIIRSDNFQLHPPRNLNTNVFRNTCGNLEYPLFFRADWNGDHFQMMAFHPEVLKTGVCKPA